jgi:hypothetical protein
MSAFIVHREHISVPIWAGLQRVGHSGPLRWHFDNPTDIRELTPGNATQVGRMLLDENTASVNHLYTERHDISSSYTYRHPRQIGWSSSELLNALHCYQHQACAHPGWGSSEAHAFCRALQQRLIHRLPGYTDGPWAISKTSTPAAHRRS